MSKYPQALRVSINEAQAMLRRAPAGSEFHFYIRTYVFGADGNNPTPGKPNDPVYNYVDVSKQHMLRVLRGTGDTMRRRGASAEAAYVHLAVLPKDAGRGNDYWL